MAKSLILLFSLLILTVQINAEGEETTSGGTCDKILDSMINSCKGIRATLLSTSSLDPKVACCKNARYDLCVQGVSGYITASKTARLCQDSNYEEKLENLKDNVAMQAVKALCANYDSKTCITDTMSSAWNTISETLNPSKLQNSFQEAMSSISGFVRNLGNGSGSSSSSSNEYSLVSDDNKQQPAASDSEQSFSFSKLWNSISSPAVEFVQKNDENNNQKKNNEQSGNSANQFLESLTGLFRTN